MSARSWRRAQQQRVLEEAAREKAMAMLARIVSGLASSVQRVDTARQSETGAKATDTAQQTYYLQRVAT